MTVMEFVILTIVIAFFVANLINWRTLNKVTDAQNDAIIRNSIEIGHILASLGRMEKREKEREGEL